VRLKASRPRNDAVDKNRSCFLYQKRKWEMSAPSPEFQNSLVDSLIAVLRDIPELVEEMAGDTERISVYHDQYPKWSNLAIAIHTMPAPGIMAVWQGTSPGSFGNVDVWKHQVTLYLRARETFDGDPPTAYYRLNSGEFWGRSGLHPLDCTLTLRNSK
jgi:hypothetical protein